jgi:alpha-tubulin suppressor-like RCC1 family protein
MYFIYGNVKLTESKANISMCTTMPPPNCTPELLSEYAIELANLKNSHCYAMSSEGRLTAYGYRSNLLGTGNTAASQKKPEEVLLPKGEIIFKLYALQETTFALCQSGHVYGWGNNHTQQLGLETDEACILQPTLIPYLNANEIQSIIQSVSRRSDTTVLTKQGTLLRSGDTVYQNTFSPPPLTSPLYDKQVIRLFSTNK